MSDENCCGACGYPIHATKDKACDWCRQSADRIEALINKPAPAPDKVGYSQAKRDLCLFLDPDLASADAWGWADDSLFAAALARLTTPKPDQIDTIAAADRIEALTEQLKTVLDREAATTARYDAKKDELEAKLAKAVEALDYCINAPFSGWTIAQGYARATLAEIEGEKG